MQPLSLRELEAQARQRLDPAIYEFFAGGADDELTLRANESAFAGIALLPRALRGRGEPKLEVSFLGSRASMPVLIAPTAFHQLADPEEGRRVPLLMDGGIRRGTDVAKALVLGATAVAVGRPVLWGLAVGGEDGVGLVLEVLRAEVARALALCGCGSPAELSRDFVRLGGGVWR